MIVFGIPFRRLLLYAGAIGLLLALNLARLGGGEDRPALRSAASGGDLPEMPDLAVGLDFGGFNAPVKRDLFRPAAVEQPPSEPEPVKAAPPPPDPDAAARREAEALLDSVRVIGFLSTAEGVLAVISVRGKVVNAFAGDSPVPGFRVSDVTINSITLRHRELDLQRTFELNESQ